MVEIYRMAAHFVGLCVVLWCCLFISGCADSKDRLADNQTMLPETDKLSVYATIFPVYDFARQVGGELIQVEQLVADGVEPHEWEPTPKDLANMEQADVLLYNGAGMEPWLAKVLVSLENKGVVTIDCSAGVSLLSGEGLSNAQIDPHIWLDPGNAIIMVNNIKNGFVQADPDHASDYQKQAAAYEKHLSDLDQLYEDTLSQAKTRQFIVSHDSFGYLAYRYNLEQVSIRGLSPDADPNPARMSEIIEIIRKSGVKYVFNESLVSPRVSEVIAQETGADTLNLNPLEGITVEERQAGHNYLSLMEENLQNLVLALEVQQ